MSLTRFTSLLKGISYHRLPYECKQIYQSIVCVYSGEARRKMRGEMVSQAREIGNYAYILK